MAKKFWLGRSDPNFILFLNFISWIFSGHKADVWTSLLTVHIYFLSPADLSARINHGRKHPFSNETWRFTLFSKIGRVFKKKIASKHSVSGRHFELNRRWVNGNFLTWSGYQKHTLFFLALCRNRGLLINIKHILWFGRSAGQQIAKLFQRSNLSLEDNQEIKLWNKIKIWSYLTFSLNFFIYIFIGNKKFPPMHFQ